MYKWLNIHVYFLQQKCSVNNVLICDISFIFAAILFAGCHPQQKHYSDVTPYCRRKCDH